MKDTAQQIETLRDFANQRLQNHIAELETHYQNRYLGSPDLKTQAHREHREIFQKELSDKMKELIKEENEFLRPALDQLRDKFLQKLDGGQ
jgi:flagellar motor switch protein FliG